MLLFIIDKDQIIGNSISAIVFNVDMSPAAVEYNQTSNATSSVLARANVMVAHDLLNNTSVLKYCGSKMCPGPETEVKRPDNRQVSY
jgi:hypothetical protein